MEDINAMSGGGGFENPGYDPMSWHDGEDGDGDDDQENQDETNPFIPGSASTPFNGGEEIELPRLKILPHEQSGLPETSLNETSFGGAQFSSELASISAKKLLYYISATDLEVSYGPNGRLQVKMVGIGKKSYDLYTMKRGTREQQLNPKLTKEIKNALGKSIYEMREDVVQQTAEKEKQLEQAVSAADAREKVKDDLNKIRNQMRQIDERRDALEEKHGNLDTEEIQKLKNQKNALEKEHQEKRKQLEKNSKAAEKAPKIKEDIRKLTEQNAKLSQAIAELQEKINTEALNELKEQKAELERQNEEDRVIINDENATSSDKTAAEARVAEREEEIGQLTRQIEAIERDVPLRDRIKEIFKKWRYLDGDCSCGRCNDWRCNWRNHQLFESPREGVGKWAKRNRPKKRFAFARPDRLDCFFPFQNCGPGHRFSGRAHPAAGWPGSGLGNGLKEIGQKSASLSPGLIGSIVSFLFKSAGRAIGFLAEHTWLLILTIVAFLVEMYLKKRNR